MNTTAPLSPRALQLFEPDRTGIYAIDEAAHLAGTRRHTVLAWCRHGLVSVRTDPLYGGFTFDGEAVRTLRQIAALREAAGFDIAGLKIALSLTREVDRLRGEICAARREIFSEPSPKGTV